MTTVDCISRKREIIDISNYDFEDNIEDQKKQKVVLFSSSSSSSSSSSVINIEEEEEEEEIELQMEDMQIHTLADILKTCELKSVNNETMKDLPTSVKFLNFVDQLFGEVPDVVKKIYPKESGNPMFGMSVVIHHAAHVIGIPPEAKYRYCILNSNESLARDEIKFLSTASRDTLFSPAIVREIYDTFASTYAKNFKMSNEAIYVKTVHLLLWAFGHRRDVLREKVGEFLNATQFLIDEDKKSNLRIFCDTVSLKKDLLRGKLENYGIFTFEAIIRAADDAYRCVMSEVLSECMFFTAVTAIDCMGESTLRLCAISVDYVARVWWPYIQRYYLNKKDEYSFDSSSWTCLEIYCPKTPTYLIGESFYSNLYFFFENTVSKAFKSQFTKIVVPEGQEKLTLLFENVPK
jgi:hypothetical protein